MPRRASSASALLPHAVCLVPVELPTAPSSAAAAHDFTFADVPKLCSGLRSGDEAAFRFVHEQWNQRIVRYCLALAAGNEAMAMECVQATWLRIYRQLQPLPDESALWRWIACAARSAASDLHRVGGRYRRALQRFTEWLHLGSVRATKSPGESQVFAALDLALDALDTDERLLLDARYFRRVPLEEIARQSGTTTRAIEGRLARLRDRLRHAIATSLRNERL